MSIFTKRIFFTKVAILLPSFTQLKCNVPFMLMVAMRRDKSIAANSTA